MAESKEFILKMAVDASGFESGIKAAEGFIKHLEDVYKQVAENTSRSGKKTEDSTKKIGDSAKKAAKDVEASFRTVGPTIEGFRKNLDNLSKGGFGSFTELNSALSLLGRGFTAVQSVATSAFEAIGDGSHFNNVERGFQSIQASVGLVADESLAKLRTAVGGTVSDLDLMERASKAVLLGLDPTKLDVMAEAAVKLGAAVGRNATEAFDDLVTGVGRGSALILDNLGIIVDTEGAYQKFADANKKLKSDLSDTEKNLAFQQAAFAAIREKAAALPPPIEDAGRAYQRLLAVFANTKNDVAGAIASNTDLGATLNELSRTIATVDPANIVAAAKTMASAVGGIIDTVNDAAISIRYLFSDDAIAKGVRLQRDVDSFRKELNEKVNGEQSAYSKLVDSAFELVGVDRSRLAVATNLIKAEEKLADHIEGEQNRRSRIRADAEEHLKLEKELLEFSKSLDKPGKNGPPVDPKEAAKAAKEAAKALESLIDKRDQLLAKAGTAGDLLGLKNAIASGDEAGIGQFAKKLRADSEAELRAGLADSLEKAGAAGGKVFAQIVASETAIATQEALAKSAESVTKAQSALLSQSLEISLDKALEKGNLGEVQRIQRQIREASFKEQLDSERERLIAAGVDEAKAYEEARKVANANIAVDDLAHARQLEEAQKDAFRNSVDFFADIFTPVFEGEAESIEKTLKGALNRAAVGFASQMAVSLIGLDFSRIGSAQGLGQSIAASLGFKGGGVATLGDVLGNSSLQLTSSAVALDTSAGLLSAAAVALQGAAASQGTGNLVGSFLDGTTGNASGFSFGSLLEGAPGAPATPEIVGANSTIVPSTSAFSAAIPAIAAAAAAAVAYSNRGVLKGGDLNLAGQLALALPTAGLSFAYNPIKDALGFGGESAAGRDGNLREDFLRNLFGGDSPIVSTVNGPFTLNPDSVNSTRSGVGPNDIGLANPLAFALAGGSGKAGSDLANIFAEAINDADNFNESLVNTQSLMQQLGLDAGETKEQVANLFLDGKVTYDEFAASFSTLDAISQHNLQGIGAVDDAIGILTKNLENPRQALNAAGLAFVELQEIGVDTVDEITAYFTEKGQPELAKFFATLAEQGYDTFEEIANAPTDKLPQVFSIFDQYANSIGETFGQTAEQIREQADGWDNVATNIKRAEESLRSYNRTASQTPNPPSGGGSGGGGGTTDEEGDPITGRVVRGKSRRVNLNRPLNPNAR